MTPTRHDVNIVCGKCEKPVERREMTHDPLLDTYSYGVYCHGETDSGPHLTVPNVSLASGQNATWTLIAFPTKAPK